jgi:hypothetical protein
MIARARQDMRAALGATVAVLVVALTLFTFARLRDDRSDDRRITDDAIAGIAIPGEPPLAGAHEVSIEYAAAKFPVGVYRPSTSLASDQRIRDVWFRDGDNAQVFVRYDTGVILTVQPAEGMASTEAWADELVGDGIDGAIESIRGVQAFLVQQHLPSLGSVRFFLGDSLVVLVGDGDFSADQLYTLAESTIEQASAVDSQRTG